MWCFLSASSLLHVHFKVREETGPAPSQERRQLLEQISLLQRRMDSLEPVPPAEEVCLCTACYECVLLS